MIGVAIYLSRVIDKILKKTSPKIKGAVSSKNAARCDIALFIVLYFRFLK